MKSQFKCPLCKQPMEKVRGDNGVTTFDGISVYCGNKNCESQLEKVFGHARTEKDAYEIACEKWRTKIS